MDKEPSFKRGCDLRDDAVVGASETITCESCGARAESVAAGDLAWQVRPPVCPDCLRWTAVRDRVADHESGIRMERRGRFWAVYENGTLLCITVYRKGARAVVARLAGESKHGYS